MSNNWNKILITSLLLFVAALSFAQQKQPKTNSPYSRLGLGNLLNQNFAWVNAMGNLSATAQDPYHVNLLNPASLSALRSASFEIGLKARYANLMTSSGETDVWSGSLGYISLAFPIFNPISEELSRRTQAVDWGMNFALVPYTLVGYNVETIEMREDIGLISSIFEGSGGTYRFIWGNGVKYKNLSVGANLGFIFGKINRNQVVNFDSLDVSYANIFHDDFSINGFVWNVGIQYDLLLKSDRDKGKKQHKGDKLIIGVYGNSNMNIEAEGSQLYHRFNRFYNDYDTIRNVPLTTYPAKLPAEISGGLMYLKANKYRLGINYTHARWSNYENGAKPEELKNTYQISFGGEIIPQYNSYNSYLKTVRYRIGAYYGTDPRSDEFKKQLTNYGITLGIGFPIKLPRGQMSFVNTAFEFGKFGTEEGLQENYIAMTLGFTLNDDHWFFKRKFN